jgi:Asp-tRNA(Asn)/Glu-tRNA(Gln) amidotransferase A subunit family amidase
MLVNTQCRWRRYADNYADDAKVFHGMPIGLQVVCGRLEEEKVLAIAEEVEKVCLR